MVRNSFSIFKKAYEEGLETQGSGFENWLAKHNLNIQKFHQFTSSADTIFFFNRVTEIKKIANFLAQNKKERNKFSFINLVGCTGIGKTSLLQSIKQSFLKIKDKNSIISLSADDFSKESGDEDCEFNFEVTLGKLEDKELVLVDDCEKDFDHMLNNIKEFSSFSSIFIFSWAPIHWNRFKLLHNEIMGIGESIHLRCFTKDESIEFLIDRIKNISNKEKVRMFSKDALSSLASFSFGIPSIILDLSGKAIKRAYQNDKKSVDNETVKEVYFDEGLSELNTFLNECTPTTTRILKTVLLNQYPKGCAIDQIKDIVDLERTSIHYHLQKMRNVGILDEYPLKKQVLFSIKIKFLPIVENFLWGKREL
ncbi:MAG: hypothetical protein KJ771_08540 [Nanoarchaeota archaeon]|nr:hypothetical protein [Nanoarchaeota archaeon]